MIDMLSLVFFMGFWLLIPLLPVALALSVLLYAAYHAAVLRSSSNPSNS